MTGSSYRDEKTPSCGSCRSSGAGRNLGLSEPVVPSARENVSRLREARISGGYFERDGGTPPHLLPSLRNGKCSNRDYEESYCFRTGDEDSANPSSACDLLDISPWR